MDIRQKIEELKSTLRISEKEKRVAQIEERMQAADFWADQEKASKKTKELKDLKTEIQKIKDIEEMTEIVLQSQRSSGPAAGESDQTAIEDELKKLEVYTFFSGKYDDHSAIINFYAGAGGDDAQDWTEMLVRMYLKWAQLNEYTSHILYESRGGIAGIKSATVEIDGLYAYGKLKKESGVHRLVRQSPFNAKDLRQTSFALVEVMPKIEKETEIEIPESDLRIDVFRAGGHGGQSVNTTDSAVRITHVPTGITAQSQNERSQLQNKQNAMSVLRSRLAKLLENQHKEKIEELRGQLAEPEWGSQIRSYVLHPYKLVKDHRTNFESKNPDAVLAGDINGFLEAEIKNNC